MRKIALTFSVILFLIAFSLPQKSDALAIGCGCQKLKRALKAYDHYSQEDALEVSKCHGGFVIKVCL